tara:strand:- start:408 stop:707 length:300 start_codon:yes stop_codon:yes gene_type:complete
MRFSKVEKGGKYIVLKKDDATEKISYLTMMQVRAHIVNEAGKVRLVGSWRARVRAMAKCTGERAKQSEAAGAADGRFSDFCLFLVFTLTSFTWRVLDRP